jgi:hypothetical protein
MNRYAQRDAVLREMGFPTYADYLASPLWARIKRRLFKAYGLCVCGAPATEVHHRTYKRRYMEGRGKIYSFLIPICRTCHQRIEFDERGKTALGHANRILDEIQADAESRGIPQRPRNKRRIK